MKILHISEHAFDEIRACLRIIGRPTGGCLDMNGIALVVESDHYVAARPAPLCSGSARPGRPGVPFPEYDRACATAASLQ